MDILSVGPWILLAVGTVILLGAVWAVFKGKQAKSVWMMWVVGFGVSGVAIYGPAFLGQYSEFVKVLMQLQSDPTKETYASAFDKVAAGTFPAAYDSIIVQVALSQPVDGMDSLLNASLGKAKDEKRKLILTDAAATWTAKKVGANEIAQRIKNTPNAEQTLARVDPVTRSLVARALLNEPASGAGEARVTKEVLRNLSVFPRQRVAR